MKTMTVGEFKAQFSEVMEQVKAGNGIAVTYGRKKEIIGYFLPESGHSSIKRQLGPLMNKAKVIFNDDFIISDEEFVSL